ncbi:MAG: HAMP domain-containing sensor histidine kinase, partial [Pseudomonadota bacterium]
YSLFLPSFGPGAVLSEAVLTNGPLGIAWLRPQALFGIEGLDPVVHAVLWSMLLNTGAFVLVSLLTFPNALELLQGAQFINVFHLSRETKGWQASRVESEDLLIMAQRIIGGRDAQRLFAQEANHQGKAGYLPDPTPGFLEKLERELAGSVGAATAHAMIGQIVGRASVSVEELMAVADETQQMMEYSNQLEAKSDELARTALQLREANEKLTALSEQKDTFLSQISHELRTPMTSIRAFAEILQDPGLDREDHKRYADIIFGETIRLTRLLDDLLDLSVLENGTVALDVSAGDLGALIDRSIAAAALTGRLTINRVAAREQRIIETDQDRLAQVFINLIKNAEKYCDADEPELSIIVRSVGDWLQIDFVDNGTGIAPAQSEVIFEKFSRLSDGSRAGGAGLGLAICREIVMNLGGKIAYLPGQGGGAFRVSLPTRMALAAE